MSENQTEATAPAPETDDHVSAQWGVAVIPGENVSIHYTVTPITEEGAITSVTTSCALKKDGMVVDTYAGSTQQALIDPKPGQGAFGDSGVDSGVFPKEPDGELTAILAGTVKTGEETANFLFTRTFDPNV